MRLSDTLQKIKGLPDLPKDIFVLLVIFLVGIGAFLLGQGSAFEKKRGGQLRITQQEEEPLSAKLSADNSAYRESVVPPSPTTPTNSDARGMYVGARSGTTYYLPWCSGVKRIREENKVWFATKEAAIAKGYKPSTNCKGI